MSMKAEEPRHNYHARVASHVPGRIRVRLEPLARRSHTMKRIKDHLEAQDGVSDVGLNPTTGSVIVRYDRSKIHESGIIKALDDIHVLASYVSGAKPAGSGPGNGAARTLMEAVDDLNRRLKIGGLGIDLRNALPLAFLGAGIWSIAKAGLGLEKIPPFLFLWLALDTFVKLHPPAEAWKTTSIEPAPARWV
ncbi:MAG: HMA2 domain-containing protein [Syntrophorhabdales bacterium]